LVWAANTAILIDQILKDIISHALSKMTSAEIVSIANQIEKQSPVGEWRVNGVHVWPLIRIRLFYDLFDNSAPVSKRSAVVSGMSRMFSRMRGLCRYFVASASDTSKNAALSPVEAIFFSDGISFASSDGRFHERFCDPIIDRCMDRGSKSLLLTPLYLCPTPRSKASLFVQPALDRARLRGLLAAVFSEPEVLLTRYDDAKHILQSVAPKVHLPSVAVLHRQTCQLLALADRFEQILLQSTPRLAFLVSYYWLEGMALILACRRLGIPTVDIQHGVQGKNHIAYGRWNNVPKNGFDLLPSRFWCWHSSDVAAIEEWAQQCAGKHAAFVGGNLWLAQWLKKSEETSEGSFAQLKRHVGTNVLLTLQPGLIEPDQLRLFADLISAAPADWEWWIRLHPSMMDDYEANMRILSQANLPVRGTDSASRLPLYGVLPHMNLHVSHSSSTVIEAAAFGVPSVLVSDYAREIFAEEESNGWVLFAKQVPEIVSCLKSQIGARSRQGSLPEVCGDEVLDDLFDLPQAAGVEAK
jgi:hypothetical protein